MSDRGSAARALQTLATTAACGSFALIHSVFGAVFIVAAGAAAAHQSNNTAYAELTVSSRMVRYALTLSAIADSPLAIAV